MYSRDILCLENFTKINLKGIYNGPNLSEKLKRNIATYQSHYIPIRGQPYKLTHADKLILDIKDFAELKFGSNILTQVLPHVERPDIIYCFDENGKSVTSELIDCFPRREEHTGEIYSKEVVLSQKPQFADKMDKMKMVSIVIGSWNFFLRETKVPTGVLRMKLDQLRMIGYEPVLIHWNDWVPNSLQGKEEILVTEIEKILKQTKD